MLTEAQARRYSRQTGAYCIPQNTIGVQTQHARLRGRRTIQPLETQRQFQFIS